ncbi:lysozyme [Parasutterella excrementihominis]|nr:N-acetylmuramoyl-L-alanine amidase [Parasutterella excrementihominis]KAB5324052.1 lysozyme [Bacteroides stercoris]MSA33701.1 lysozyme [Parabacteroides distasonis]MSA77419.1 lysozyme [Parabacteroides distasonis]MTU02683.1 lysozyme [Parasutterella excrementihominis]MTU16843.1 lysozyme [Parasutterella excrementihominis]
MVKKINTVLMDVGPLISIDGVVIHNDAGSGSPERYVNWLAGRNKDLGIAHYYITKDCIARVIDTNLIGYHTGRWPSNQRYIGYEVCQSMSASDADFLANEDMTLMQAAEDLLFYGLPINGNTVRLHHEFVSTSCPHRSMALHGNSTESVKQYFIDRIKYFASLGTTVDEMLAKQGQQPVDVAKTQQEEEGEEIMLMVRSKSGKQGYVGLVNGSAFGIGYIETVSTFMKAGAKEVTLPDDDFNRLIESQKIDEKTLVSINEISKKISSQNAEKTK